MPIAPPPQPPFDHPDSLIGVQEALEPAFAELERAAQNAGWEKRETAIALLRLARSQIQAIKENARTDAAVRKAQDQ